MGKPSKNPNNEIHITRLYDAPVSAVWDAWADSKQVAQWWGPRGFTITTHSKDLRPGGHWNYTMHGPDGTNYENKTKYFEVEKNAKLVYDHGGNDEQAPLFRVTVLFSESRGKTKMEMSMALPTPEALEGTKTIIRKHGGNSTWDRLAEYLEKEATGKDAFVINRSFDCPLEKMFDLWTVPEHFSKWLAPTGMTMEFIKADIREGGTSFYAMSGNGVKMHGKAHYLKIRRPDYIEYTQEFSDEKGNIARHPMVATWPERMLTRVTLTAEGPEQTRVTVRWEPYGQSTGEELATFVKMRGGMTMGWTGSFDKLEALLASEAEAVPA